MVSEGILLTLLAAMAAASWALLILSLATFIRAGYVAFRNWKSKRHDAGNCQEAEA